MLATFGLDSETYTLTQLRYDLRKIKGHGLLHRVGRSYRYRLTPKGNRVCLLFVLFHQRVCGPLAHSLFHRSASVLRQSTEEDPCKGRNADHGLWLPGILRGELGL